MLVDRDLLAHERVWAARHPGLGLPLTPGALLSLSGAEPSNFREEVDLSGGGAGAPAGPNRRRSR